MNHQITAQSPVLTTDYIVGGFVLLLPKLNEQ